MQIINTNPGQLIVKIIPKYGFSKKHINEIENTLSKNQGMPFFTKVQIVNEIDSTKRGKHRFLIKEFDE